MTTLESIENSNGKGTNVVKSHSSVDDSSESLTSQVKSSPLCSLCEENHYLNQCKLFKARSVKERKDFVILKRLCF